MDIESGDCSSTDTYHYCIMNTAGPKQMKTDAILCFLIYFSPQNKSSKQVNSFLSLGHLKLNMTLLIFLLDPGTPYANKIQFQHPLPPGSPCFSSPPPLPQGTPPATPTPPPLPKGTPPLTPRNGSLALQGQDWRVVDEIVEGTEDELTLEELEEQQRMIRAALEADTATTSDCETPLPSSACMSTPVHVSKEISDTEELPVATEPIESCHNSEIEEEPGPQEMSPQALTPVKGEDDIPQPVRAQSPGQIIAEEDSPQSPDPTESQVTKPESSQLSECQEDVAPAPVPEAAPDPVSQDVRKVTAVPHRSYFAAGIVPFEDTPEFTEVATATGTYLKIRGLLKSSSRNLGKKK